MKRCTAARGGLLMVALLALAACASSNRGTDEAGVPRDFALTLATQSSAGKYTYFELTDKGELSYGGGQAGAHKVAKPVTTLTAQQRAELWEIVTRHDLFAAENRLFAKAKEIGYDVSLRGGGRRASYRTIDANVPGLKELHDRLFNYQAQVRYKIPALEK